MKTKKTSTIAILIAFVIVAGITTAFATSAANAYPNHPSFDNFPSNTQNTKENDNSASEISLPKIRIGDSSYKERSVESLSCNKKIQFNVESINSGENVEIGGYALQKGDSVQVVYENSENNISILIFQNNKNVITSPSKTKILTGTTHEISQDGDYYFAIQNDASNGISNNIKGTIQLNYQNPQKVHDERIQFTEDAPTSNESQSTRNPVESAQQPTGNTGTTKQNTAGVIKSLDGNDNIFDDNATVLKYYDKNAYTADNYQEDVRTKETTLDFANFSGSQVLYELNFAQDTTVDFRIIASIDGEYKIAFITEANEIIMKASSYNGLPASRPIDIPRGKTKIVLIGEQATGICSITLDY